jgi:hypothetical protein
METADFQYTRLDSRHIRVLQRVSDDQLRTNTPSYRLLPVNLDSHPEFVAVSYVWGEPGLTREINISGKTLKVTNSLYNAVQDVFEALGGLLRLSDSQCREEISIWIDGVCINQESDLEKSEQVALMGEIYRGAFLTITYAGPHGVEARCALKLICDCNKFIQESMLRIVQNGSLEQANFPSPEHESYRALRKLLRLPWSARAWIVQESVMAQRNLLVIGTTLFEWTSLATIVESTRRGLLPAICISSEEEWLNDGYLNPDYVLMQSNLKKDAWTKDGNLSKTLCQLLRRCHSFVSSNPKDKIYAFLSMAKDREELGIKPNYLLSTRDIYIDTTTRILRAEQRLDVLSSVRREKNNKKINLPSWVPDWSSSDFPRWGANNYLWYRGLLEKGLFRADGGRLPQIHFNADGTELTLRGVIFDQLCLITNPDFRGDHNPKYPNAIEGGSANRELFMSLLASVQTVLECCSEEMKMNTYPNSGGVKEAFWRTLIANVDDFGREADREYERCYDDYAKLQQDMFKKEFGHESALDEVARLRAMRFATAMKLMSIQRSVGLTHKGYIASVPGHAEPGDFICVLFGGKVPFIIRPEARESRYVLLGDTYVHGIMKGEAVEGVANELITDVTFV